MNKVWNRKAAQLEDVRYYKNEAIIFVHKNPIASFIMSNIAVWPFFSTLMALRDYTRFSRKKVLDFVSENNLDETEFEKPASEYSSFSEFFDRRLKPQARPVCQQNDTIVSPADGALTIFPNISGIPAFAIKGQKFTLASLLRDEQLAGEYSNGSLAVIYLSPTDYHRYHFPCDCTMEKIWTLGAKLFSVNPIAMEHGYRPFDVNVRDISILSNEKTGQFLMIEVGALYVGRMVRTSPGPGKKARGEEKGYFGLGGSTIVLVFKKGAVKFDEDIIEMSSYDIPSRVRMGERIAVV
ncbi:MAG TPA: archaetidylserine decarboxylase [Desulfomonilia bacterium]